MRLSGAVLDKLVKATSSVGLNHSMVMGPALILEGGVDHMKAVRVKVFRDVITDGTGFISPQLAQKNMLAARRALLKTVVESLKEGGAIVKKEDLCHGSTVDEIYELEIDGVEASLVLAP